MIARTKTVRAERGEFEDGRRFFEEVVLSCCRQTPGFRGGWFLTDPDGGRTVTFTLWDDEAAWRGARRLLSERLDRDPEIARRLRTINARGVTFEGFEVVAEA